MRRALQQIVVGPAPASTLDFADILSGLALHYWRPDFSAKEAMRLNADYIEDLRGVTADELRAACKAWRCNPDNRFYPTTGQLLALVKHGLAERAQRARGAEYLLSLLEADAPSSPAEGRGGIVAQQLHELAERMRVK